jgi:hypothetical protein
MVLSEVAKTIEQYLNDLILILSFSQIWLNLLVNHHHFGYNIKLTPKKRKERKHCLHPQHECSQTVDTSLFLTLGI